MREILLIAGSAHQSRIDERKIYVVAFPVAYISLGLCSRYDTFLYVCSVVDRRIECIVGYLAALEVVKVKAIHRHKSHCYHIQFLFS